MSDFSLSTRRTFLAGALGTAGLLAAGWSGWPMYAGYRTAFQLEAKKLDHHAPLYTLRRSIVVSTWSGATLLRFLAKHRP